MSWLLVVTGGMLGAVLRYLVDHVVQVRRRPLFPWATFTVNIAGCQILGVLAGASAAGAAPDAVQLLVGTGLCGALTTYSTLSYETLRLTQTGARFLAAVNVIFTVAAGLSALALGTVLATAVWS